MLELAGAPVINREDYNLRELKDYPPTLGEATSAQFFANTALNPTVQAYDLNRLNQAREQEPSFYIDEMGNQVPVAGSGTLNSSDPQARKLSVEDANARGEAVGLRFSEPPTQAQFDYLRDLKQAENARDEVMSQVPTLSGRNALGFLAGFAGNAIDPLNIASAFVPVVGESRYLRMIESIGLHKARLAKGALEGGVGNALTIPLVYGQAEALQQNYGVSGAFQDIIFGAGLGAGLHWGGGALGDLIRGRVSASVEKTLRDSAPADPNGGPGGTPLDRRKIRVNEGENATVVESMDRDTRTGMLSAAVKAVATDALPKIDVLLKSAPELRELSIPDQRFPATVRLRNEVTASDFALGTRAAQIFDAAAERMGVGKGGTPTPQKLFDGFAARYKKLSDFSLKQVTPQEFAARAANMLEDPNQRAVVEPGSKTILVTDGASMGAVRHEIERALDSAYGVTGDAQGGYRYHKKDAEGQTEHRLAIRALYEQFPERAPRTPTPDESVDLFSRREPLMGADGPKASDQAWQEVEQRKDLDLETMIKDEEIDAVESITQNITGMVRDLGIMEKVIPAEEREILDQAVANQEKLKATKSLAKAVDGAVERDVGTRTLDDAEILMRDGVDALKGIILEGKTTKQAIADAKANKPELVTRSQALKSINAFQKSADTPLTGAALERAIRMVQDGEEIDVAVQGAGLLARADQAAETPTGAAAGFEAPGEKSTDQIFDEVFSDMDEDAVEIIKDNRAKRALAEAEARLVQEEHDALSANPKTADLASSIERTEFNEAQRDRTLREGTGTLSSSERARARSGSAGSPLEDGLFATRTSRDGETARGVGPAAEREGSAPGGERGAPETAISYGAGTVPRRIITPDSSIEISVEPKLVELENLDHATGDLQVRDRSRKESEVEAFERAIKLDPEQLMPQRVADAGAPIVVAGATPGRYTIISGNGRTLSLRKVYGDETLAWKANQYRDRLGPAADGYRRPVLVSVITDQLTHDELVRFAERANRSRIAELSITEKAQRDADAAGIDLMMLYQGGDFTKKENQPFLRAFMRKVATAQEQGEMSKNGVLTKPGVDRLNAAVLASAYDDTGVLSLMLESTDNNIKSIASAYRDVAPIFMKLRAEIAQGLVREEVDITTEMMAAARFVQEARNNGVKIANALAQIDALSPIDPVVDRLIRQFYNPQLTRANSALRIADILRRYAEGAREKRLGGFFEDATTPLDVMNAAERQSARNADETVLASEETDLGESPNGLGQGAPEPAPISPGEDVAGRSASPNDQTATGPAAGTSSSFVSILNRQGEAALRARLESMKVAEIRAEAARQTLAAKGRSREQIIGALIESAKAAKDDRLAAASGFDSAAEERSTAPRETPPELTLENIPQLERTAPPLKERAEAAGLPQHEQALREAGWLNARDDLKIALEEFGSADKYLGKKPEALSALRSMEKKVKYALEKAIKGETEAADAALRGALRDAEELTGIEPGPAGKLYTQYVRNAARNRGIEVPPLPAPKRKAPTSIAKEPGTGGGGSSAPSPAREAFYDYLEGDKPVKGAATIAKALKINAEAAYKLLDEGVEAGWLKQKENGDYMRVAKTKRPARTTPDITDFMGDVVGTISPATDASRLPLLHAQRVKALRMLAELEPEIARLEELQKSIGGIDEHDSRSLDVLSDEFDRLADDDDIIAAEIGRIEDRLQKQRMAVRKVTEDSQQIKDASAHIWGLQNQADELARQIEAGAGSDFASRRALQEKIKQLTKLEDDLYNLRGEFEALRAKVLTEAGFEVPDRIFMPTVLDKLETDLNAFMDSGRRNAWIYGDTIRADGEPEYSLYMRNALRPDEHGNMVKSLDISSVQVAETGQGRFQQMLDVIERVAYAKDMDILYVENVQTEKFANFFRKLGWIEEPRIARYDEPSFIKRMKPSEHIVPKGWDVIEGNEPAIVAVTETAAIAWIARAEGITPREVEATWGYANRRDYVDLATLKGFDPGIHYVKVRAAELERDLQATLAIQRAVGDALHRVPDVIGFEIMDALSADSHFGNGIAGTFLPWHNMIVLSKGMLRNAIEVVNHETFHALRNLKLFTQYEWDIIKNAYQRAIGVSGERQANYQAYFMGHFEKFFPQDAAARMTTDKLAEEWAATDYGQWMLRRSRERATPIDMLWGRVFDFLADLGRSMENLARRATGLEQKITAEDIFRAISDGTIAKRFEEWGGGAGDGNKLTVKNQASDDTAKMMNDMMRETAKDEHEKIGRVQEDALRAMAPCAAYNL